jgi:hypothetical protein
LALFWLAHVTSEFFTSAQGSLTCSPS